MKRRRTVEQYYKLLEIDLENLSYYIASQPQFFMEVCNVLNESRSYLARLKHELELVKNKQSTYVRKSFLAKNIKVTERRIEEDVLLNSGVVDYNENIIDAKKLVDDWESLREAFVQRSLMLRELARIQINESISDPSHTESTVKKLVYDKTGRHFVKD